VGREVQLVEKALGSLACQAFQGSGQKTEATAVLIEPSLGQDTMTLGGSWWELALRGQGR